MGNLYRTLVHDFLVSRRLFPCYSTPAAPRRTESRNCYRLLSQLDGTPPPANFVHSDLSLEVRRRGWRKEETYFRWGRSGYLDIDSHYTYAHANIPIPLLFLGNFIINLYPFAELAMSLAGPKHVRVRSVRSRDRGRGRGRERKIWCRSRDPGS